MRYIRRRELINAAPIGRRLKEVRKYFGYKQGKMAELLGITMDAYGKNERGTHLVQTDSLHAVHEKLGVSMEWLLFNRGSMFWNADIMKKGKKGGKREEILFSSEVDEMIDLMKRVPFLRYAVMGYYQKFKIENKHLVTEILEKEEKAD